MSQYINRAQILGNLSQDPLVKDSCTAFTLATNYNHRNTDGELVSQATFHNCVAFASHGRLMAHYKKGQFMLVE